MSATERMANETPERSEPKRPEPDRTAQFRPFSANPGATTEWEEPQEEKPERMRHIVDRFDGAAGLFVLRLAVAVILGIRGLQKIQHLDVTQQQVTDLGLPSPSILAAVIAYGQFAIALALLLALVVRVLDAFAEALDTLDLRPSRKVHSVS